MMNELIDRIQMREVLDEILEYQDSWRCFVCLPAVRAKEYHPDQEDSLHKTGHILTLLGLCSRFGKLELGFELFFPRSRYFDYKSPRTVSMRRHPLTRYTTSRDQVMPALMSLFLEHGHVRVGEVIKWLDTCPVEKDTWKKLEWLIKCFYHTPNGDLLQPDHVSILIRCMNSPTLWASTLRMYFGDWWRLMGTFVYLYKGFSHHYVNHTLEVLFARFVKPTVFSYINYLIWRKYGEPQRVYDEYFHTPNNPPIGELHRIVVERINSV